MARIRTIKPEFNTSESVARMSESAQLFMVKILAEMDDYGRVVWLPKKIAGNLYPFREDVGPSEIEALAQELVDEGIFLKYEVDGKVYGCFPNWKDHQRVDKPGKETIPPPPLTTPSDKSTETMTPLAGETTETVQESSRESRETLAPGIGNREREEGNGRVCETRPGEISGSDTERIENRIAVVETRIVEDPPDADEAFAEFKAAYPDCPNWNEVTAKRAFGYLVESSVDTRKVVEGAKRFAVAIRAAGKEGTQFVMSPATFLKLADRHWEAPWTPPKKARGGESVVDMQQRLEAVLNGEAK